MERVDCKKRSRDRARPRSAGKCTARQQSLRCRHAHRPQSCVRRFRPCQSGAAIVEAVIALPILLVVILGSIQFGLSYEAKTTLKHASLQAARGSTEIGAQSDLNIQDANLLKVEITYGDELKVPLANWFISHVLPGVRRGGATMNAFERQLLRRTLLPIVATSTVRRQSPARMSAAMGARGDLPQVDRIPWCNIDPAWVE